MATMVQDWDKYTRTHWAGEGADVDIHLEMYKGIIDGEFNYRSFFKNHKLAETINLVDTNTYRWDRDGAAEAYGRRSGEELVAQRLVNEKVTSVIDTALYSRHTFDRQDDWTSPDRTQRVGRAQGQAIAREHDKAGTTALIHATEWKAPVSLKKSGAFHDGYNKVITGITAETDKTAKADMIVEEHSNLLLHLHETDQYDDLGNFITLVSPEWFDYLQNHDKLMNVEYSNGNGDFAQYTMARMNGVKLLVMPTLNGKEVKAAENPFGAKFARTAAQAKTGLILVNPQHTLMELVAKGNTVNTYKNEDTWQRVLETYQYSEFVIRRGDSCLGLRAD